ncbi:MAG: hydroxyphenylacetyl-CoA thioesterase PaaI [Gammaproteobacteria bacterium]
MGNPRPDPQALAERVRDALWRDDAASRALGMSIVAIAPGTARLTMTVRPDMLNGHGICHGGLLTTFADTAMAFASNSHNESAVASHLSADFIAPARLDDVLTASAIETARTQRTGVYDVTVNNQHGAALVVVRGRVHRVPGKSIVSA